MKNKQKYYLGYPSYGTNFPVISFGLGFGEVSKSKGIRIDFNLLSRSRVNANWHLS